MASQHSQPFWRTRRARRGAPEGDSVQQATLTSLYPRAPTVKNGGSPENSEDTSIPRREAAERMVNRIAEESQKSIISLKSRNTPQEDGFIGLFILVCCWQADWRSETKRRQGRKSPFAGRISHQQPLDTVKIGEGASFTVYKRYDSGSSGRQPKLVVMKDSKARFIRDGRAADQEVLNCLLAEIRVLSHESLRRHPNIVKLLDVRWDHPLLDQESIGPTLYLEYAELGTLADFYASSHPKASDISAATLILENVWNGIYALHLCSVVHGDIKPSNVLVFIDRETVVAKLSDFGCAILVSQQTADKVALKGFSPPWDAPEAGSDIEISLLEKTDIYSYGLLYWWVRLGGRDPFGLDLDGPSQFGFSGSRSSKLESLKRLKQTEGLASRIYHSIMSTQSGQDVKDEYHTRLECEVRRIGNNVLVVDATQRSIGQHLYQTADSSDVNDWNYKIAQKLSWTRTSPWKLPMRYSPDEKIPSKRFVHVLRHNLADKSGTNAEQTDTAVLLFRCFLEGFGVAQSYELAASFLKDASQLGDPASQALLKFYYDVIGAENFPPITLEPSVAAILQGERDLLAKIDLVVYELATKERNILDLKDKTMISEQELLVELTSSRAPQEIDSWLGHPLAGRQKSLIHHAAARGWLRVMEKLLESDGLYSCSKHLSLHDFYGYTPLMYACKYGHAEAALFLLKIGPSNAIVPGTGAPHMFLLLSNLHRRSDGKHALLKEVVDGLIQAGADPDQKTLKDFREAMILGTVPRVEWEDLGCHHLGNPLSYATWIGDLEIVECLLGVGATPDLLCLHIAAALHRVDILELLLSNTGYAWPTIESCNLGSTTLLDTALMDSPLFDHSKRMIGTQMRHDESLKQIVAFIVSRSAKISSFMSSYATSSYLLQCCRLGVKDQNLIRQLLYPESHISSVQPPPELMFTAISWNQASIVAHLLDLGGRCQDAHDFSALHACASSRASSNLCLTFQDHVKDVNLKQKNKTATGLETPFQMAVACQNFAVASWLFENGASKDEVILSTRDHAEDCTLLGWLVKIIWSESRKRIQYLLEEYPNEPMPHFLVRPHVGHSVLQEVARISLSSDLQERDVREMMEYLVTKYPGSRHLEYQRIDDATVVKGDAQHSGLIFTLVDGKPVAAKNSYHFNRNVELYPGTEKKEHNGTALHFAVRSTNYAAVCVLIEAGADVSAMLGMPLPESNSMKWSRGASTYATKENRWASTVLDFALLVHDSLMAESKPTSSPFTLDSDSIASHRYRKQRSQDIMRLLQQKGAANSLTFLRKYNEEKIYAERRQKGNFAALRMFQKDVKEGLSYAWKLHKTTKQEIKEVKSTTYFTAEATKINFANSFLRQGKLDEALKLYIEVRDQIENNPLLRDSPDRLAVLANIAVVFKEQGKYVEAEELCMTVFKEQKKTLGLEHPSTLHTMNNLGVIFFKQEKFELADEWSQKALLGREKTLGPDDPKTLETVALIGGLRLAQERLEEAEAAYKRALPGLELALGADNIETLRAAHNLGVVYKFKSQWADAKIMLQRAANGNEIALGMENLETIRSVAYLGLVIEELEDFDSAVALELRALSVYQEQLGFEDSRVTNTAYALGRLYRKTKKWTESSQMYQICLTGEETRLGPDHKDTLLTRKHLGIVYKSQGLYEKAIEEFNSVLEGKARTSSMEDETSLDTYFRLGLVYKAQGLYEKAIEAYNQVLDVKLRTSDIRDRLSVDTHWNLAAIYRWEMSDRLPTARTHYEKATGGYEVLLGPENSETLSGYSSLGHVCKELNDLAAAESYFRKAEDGYTKTLGLEHEKTLDSLDQVAAVVYALGDYSGAVVIFERALDVRKKSLTPNHPDIVKTEKNIAICISLMPHQSDNPESGTMVTEHYRDTSAGSYTISSTNTDLAAQGASPLPSESTQPTRVVGPSNDEWIEQLVGSISAPPKSSTRVYWSLSVIAALLSNGTSTESRDPNGLTALLWAVQHGNNEALLTLIDIGANVHAVDSSGRTPLHVASTSGSQEMVARLILAGAIKEANDDEGMTAIHHAILEGHISVVKFLLDSFDASSQDDLMQYLEMTDNNGNAAIHLACLKGHTELVEILLERGVNVSQPESQFGLTPILIAVDGGHEETIHLLLSHGVEADDVSIAGLGAIHYAAWKGHLGVLQMLLDNGANIESQCLSNDWSPLFWAADTNRVSIAEALLKRGARVDARDISHRTLTHVAALKGSTGVMELLLQNGADCSANDENYSTPLHFAAVGGVLEAVSLLLAHSPLDVHAKDGNGRTPLSPAAAGGHDDVVSALLDFGSAVNMKDSQGATPLHFAAVAGRDAVVRVLLDRGADAALKDQKGQTALQLAAMGNHMEVVMMLALAAQR